MSELVVVANGGPFSLTVEAGRVEVGRAAGGLAPSLAAALQGRGARWIAAARFGAEQEVAARGLTVPTTEGLQVHLVGIPGEMAAAHRMIANGTLWFLHHGLFDRTRRPTIDRRWHEAWRQFRAYNACFAEEIARRAPEGATVVVNDYHLSLVGGRLAVLRPDLETVHFTHTSFCDPDELRVLPRAVAAELVAGIASFGAAGFHTERWADNFRRCAAEFLADDPRVVVAPLGVDAPRLAAISATPVVERARSELFTTVAGRRIVFRSDRLELSKNIVRGFLAFEELLEAERSLRDSVVFLAHLYPSREELPEYLAYRNEVERTAARLNERFGSSDRSPVALEIADDHDASLAELSSFDVLLVNTLRDGMNLVAKEGAVLNRRDGVLALSREVGAFAELGGAAVAVEPFDISGTAAAIRRALEMPASERRARARRLRDLAALHPPAQWLAEVAAQARPGRRPRLK
ncbi:MAG: trehalose-6-phosphate synthase [Acidimicrobiales bacterium]